MNGFNVWLIAVILIFGFVQLYQWLQTVLLPLPLYVIAGAFLAIASNLHRGIGSSNIPSSAAESLIEQKLLLPESPEE